MAVTIIGGISAVVGAAGAAGALASFGAFVTFLGTSAAFTAFAIGAGLSLVSRALAPKPSFGEQLRGITQTTRDPAGSRKLVYGQMRVGGQVVFIANSGNENEYLHLVIAFASHEIESYEEFWFNDKQVYVNNAVDSSWSDVVTITKFDGTQTTADSTLTAVSNKWTSNHILNGIAYAHFKLKWDQDKFPQGVPNITAVIKGKKVYDPRDTNQSATDSSTWTFSQNPALCLRDYLVDSKYGLGEDRLLIDSTALTNAANLCDETQESAVDIYSTGAKRYELNGVIDTANNIKDNIEQMLSAMGGKFTFSGGKYFIDGAEYRTPTITLDESVTISEIQVQTKQSRRGIYNGVKGIFVSEEKNYKVLDYPAQISSTYATEDGDPIYLDMPLPFVTSNLQAQLLAKLALLKSRQQTTLTMTVNLTGLKLKVGDTVMVTNTRLGYSSKVFEIIDYTLANTPGGEFGVQLTLIETASAIYDWTSSDEQDFLKGGELDLYDGRTVDNVTSLSMTEIGLRGPDGGVKSAVELSWTAPDDAFIEYYTVRYNKNGTTNYFEVQTRETNVLLEGLDVTSNYDFQVKAQNLIGVRSSGTSLTNQALNGDTTAPSAPTSGAATGGIQTITAEWSNPTDIDFKHVEIFVNTTDSIPATPTAVVDGEEYIVTGLSGKETRYFWLKSVDFSGNKSAATASFSATAVKALSGDIDNDAIGSDQIADDAVNNDHLADDSVNTDQIVDNAVTTTTISDDAITTPKIATNAVTANEIAANTITASEIASNTITASEIASNTITASEIATDTITASEIASNTITASEIASNTITASQIATDTITASEIATGAINTTELAANAVTTAKIAANAVTATEINVTSLDDISADAGTITGGSVGGISITSTTLYAGTGDWANTNTGFYVDNTGKFSLKDKFFYNPTNNLLTVDGNITADVITAKENLVVLGDLEASSMAAGSITRAMFSQDALDEIYGALATSVGGSNGDYKEASGNFTTSGGTVTVGTSSDKFDHGTADVVVEFLANHYFYTTTNYTTAQAQATLNFEVSADGTFTDLTSATKTQTLQFGEYDLTSYYGYTYLVYYFNGEHSKTFTTGSGNDIPDNTELQFRVRVTGVGTAFTSQTVPFTVEANEGVTGVVSTGGNADTLDNLDSTKFLRSDVDDTFDANLTITGNLTVNGTQTTLNTATLQVEDKNIVLNYGSGDTSGSADGAGITIQDAVNSSTDATILWNATTDKFDFSHGIDVTGATTLDGYVYVNVAGNNLVLQSDSVQRETIQWTQNNVNRWKLNLQADGDLDFVPADTADKLLYNNNEIATQSWVTSQGYVTSFSETDTLATVTGRGATTNTRLGIGTSASASYDLQIGEHLNISSGHLYVDGTVRINENGNATFNTISSGQITSSGSVTAGNASTSLGFYVGTTQVIQGSTRKLVNVIADANIITSGTLNADRIPTSVVKSTGAAPSNLDSAGMGVWRLNTGHTNQPSGTNYGTMVSFDNVSDTGFQIAAAYQGSYLYWRGGNSANYGGSGSMSSWQRIFADNYHPNADKWTTPRTLTLTGDVTGSVTWDGSGNATMTTTGGGASNDTLDDVTDRGATTTNNISVGGITASGPVSITGNGSYVGNYGYSTLVLQDSGGYAGLNFRHGSKNWLIRKNGVDDDLQFVYSDDASSQGTGTYTERFIIRHDGGFDLKSGALTSVGQITSSGSVTAGNASTSLGFYVGTTQVIQGSTRNLVNIGSITASGSSTINNKLTVSRNATQGTPNYSSGNIELYTSGNYVPSISFHRSGYSASTLYEYDGELYVNPWTTRSQTGKLLVENTGWVKQGSWYGDLGSNGYDRVQGATYTGGEFVLVEKNAQISTLVDGDYFAYEAGGFYSSNNSTYGNLSGFKATGANAVTFTQKDGGVVDVVGTRDFLVPSGGYFKANADSQSGLMDTAGTNWVIPRDQWGNFHLKVGYGQYYLDSDNHYIRNRSGAEMVRINSSGMDVKQGGVRINGTTVIDSTRRIQNASVDNYIGFTSGWHSNNLQATQMMHMDAGGGSVLQDSLQFNVAAFKVGTLYGRSGSTWTNLGTKPELTDGKTAHDWGRFTLSRSYDEFIVYFGTNLGYAFLSAVTVMHSTNGNQMTIYVESSESGGATDTGWSQIAATGSHGSWPGSTSMTLSSGVGGGFNDRFRIRIVPSWTHASNGISLGQIVVRAGYGPVTRLFDWDYTRRVAFFGNLRMNGTDFMDTDRNLFNINKLTFTSANSNVQGIYLSNQHRIYWNNQRVLEGNGTNLQVGEGLTGSVNIQAGAGLAMNGTTVIDSSRNLVNIKNAVFDNGTSTTVTIQSDDSGQSVLALHGSVQGTGRLYVGQSTSYGGGIEYNGDNSPAYSGAGSDYITLYRRSGGYVYWTARNHVNSNDWQFRGNVTAYASDERLKENIKPISDPIEKIKRLQGVEFDWRSDCEDKGFMPSMSHETGVIAQNIAEVVPDAVSPAPFDNNYLTVDKSKLVAVLIEAVKAQQEQIDQLKNIIKEMKNGNHKDD